MSQQRSRARRAAMQAIYQWQIAQQDLRDIERQFLMEQDMSQVDLEYFRELVHQVPAKLDRLDEVIADKLDRVVAQMDPIELSLLRLGTYELMFQPEIPYKVVISEAVHLAKKYGAEDGYKYVNGVLDKIARQLRQAEVQAKSTSSEN